MPSSADGCRGDLKHEAMNRTFVTGKTWIHNPSLSFPTWFYNVVVKNCNKYQSNSNERRLNGVEDGVEPTPTAQAPTGTHRFVAQNGAARIPLGPSARCLVDK